MNDIHQETRRLNIRVSPMVREGGTISVLVRGENLPETTLKIHASDLVVLDGPATVFVGSGTYTEELSIGVIRVSAKEPTMIEIEATAGPLYQMGLCKVYP